MKKILLYGFIISLFVGIGVVWILLKDIEIQSPQDTQDHSKIRGIDISHHNEVLDWNSIKKDSIQFVIIKASEGKGFKDPKFNSYASDASKHDIRKGAYHFFSPGVPASLQFKNYSGSVKLHKGDFAPILDVENKDSDIDEVNKWLELAKAQYGVEPIVYSEYSFFKAFLKDKIKTKNIWIYLDQKYWVKPAFKDYNCVFWQYSQEGRVAGINGPVDLDIFNDSIKNLANYLIK